MKALVYTAPHTVELRDVDAAQRIRDDDVIVNIAACGVCGSDMHAYHGVDERRPPPLILGHEASGTIAAGSDAGMRVAINPLVTCGTCRDCLSGRQNLCAERVIVSMMPRPGAFAEQAAVPRANCIEIADDTSWQTAALTEPFAVSYHAINLGERALTVPLMAARCAVIGGGPIGLAGAQILRARGATAIVVSEPSAQRRALIDGLGDLVSYDPASPTMPDDGTMDLVLDAYGSDRSRAHASKLVRRGGVIVHIGLASAEGGLDIRKTTLQEVTFIGSYTYTMTEFEQTLRMLEAGRFGDISWTETRALSYGPGAFAELDRGDAAAAKIILTP